MSLSKLQRALYLASRDVGDANALQKGGVSRYATRRVKRVVHRKTIGLLKGWKLW